MLVVSGSIARRGKTILSWTVNDLNCSIDIYMADCRSLKSFGVKPNKVRPSRKKMPFNCDELDEKPTDDEKIKVINVAKFFENKEKFWEILR